MNIILVIFIINILRLVYVIIIKYKLNNVEYKKNKEKKYKSSSINL